MEEDVSYELIQDDMVVAGCSGPNADKEIQHYARMYEQDGPVEMVKVVRSKFDPAAPERAAITDRPIQRLLDAAFNELQHDTGPNDVEYQHQRRALACEFAKILRAPTAPAAPDNK